MGKPSKIIQPSLDEKILEQFTGVETELEDTSTLISRPFDPDKIKVSNEKKTVDLLVRRIDNREVNLAPEFQRRARLWHPHKKSQLIESLLLRIPLPVFYVAADANDDWAVVDGLQRLTTIHDFIKSKFTLNGLEYLKQFEGASFQSLDRAMKRRIEETELVINVIQPGTPQEVMINIFKRINTGGIPLNAQEIRNALHGEPIRSFLQSLAKTKEFQDATDNSVRDERMDAQEMVLRFLAFFTTDPESYTSSELDSFLNEKMKELNALKDAQRDQLTKSFKRSMTAAREIFGDSAFRKRSSAMAIRGPVSKALFEAWGVALAKLSDRNLKALVTKKLLVQRKFRDLVDNDQTFFVAISYSTGAPSRVRNRFASVNAIISDVLRTS